jgi:hypothetical protein
MAYVYRHIRLDKNQPFYIGIGSDEHYYRATAKSHRSKIWKGIVSRTDYKVQIMCDDITFEEAKVKEKELISLYGRINLSTGTLCNLTDGGDGTSGQVFSDEHKQKIAQAHKGRKLSDEHRKKLRESGRDWSLTEEQKTHLSIIQKGIPKNKEKSARGLKSGVSRQVLDLYTGVFHESIMQFASLYCINYQTALQGLKRKSNKQYLIL